jgi:hypothetical protein
VHEGYEAIEASSIDRSAMACSRTQLFLLSLLGFALLAAAEVHEHEFIVRDPSYSCLFF